MKTISIITHQLEPKVTRTNQVLKYGIRNAAKGGDSYPGYAINSNSSVIGGLFTDTKHLLFTTNESTNPAFTLRNELEKQIDFLRKSCQTEDIQGLLVGGLEFDDNNKIAKQSYYFYSKLAEEMDKLQIPFSMICGRNKEIPPEHVYSRFNHVKISSEGFKNALTDEKISPNNVYDVIENCYNDVFYENGIKLDIKEHF